MRHIRTQQEWLAQCEQALLMAEGKDHVAIPLTRGKVTLIDHGDYALVRDSGPWYAMITAWAPYAARVETVGATAKKVLLHRVLMDAPPHMEVDHANHRTLDNRRANIRLATASENGSNRLKRPGTSSSYKGVDWQGLKGQWRARICLQGKEQLLGYFEDEQDAARAYDEAAAVLFGEFALTNLGAD